MKILGTALAAAGFICAFSIQPAEARRHHNWGYSAPVKHHYRVAKVYKAPKVAYRKARRVTAVAVYAPSFEFGHLQVAFGAPRSYASYKPTAGVFGTHTKAVAAPRVARAVKPRVETIKAAIVRRTAPVNTASSFTNARPSECYGIAWCGCYLAHVLGLPRVTKVAGRTLNLYMANDWRFMGREASGPAPGVVVVWPNRHVGRIVSVVNESIAMVESGNYGNQHHAVVARISIRGLILRQL